MELKQINKNKIEKYIGALNTMIKENKISNWKINQIEKNKSNIYIEANYQIESILNSKREELIFTIYKDFKEELMGENSFNINIEDDFEKFEKQLNESIFICSQSKSKKYTLPNNSDSNVKDENINYDIFYNTKFKSDFENQNLNLFFAEKLEILKKIIQEKKNDEISIKLNNIEFLNSFSKTSIQTSKNINKSYQKNSSYLELVLTSIKKSNKAETEFVIYEPLNEIYNFDFEKFFKESINYCIDTSKENKAENFNGKIILNEKATLDFFNPDLTMNSIIGHTSGRLKFLNISKYEKDEPILDAKMDKLTIYSNPLLENNKVSTPYDLDGITGEKICLIKNNIFKNHFTSKQYADYLNIKPTGPFGVIQIENGTKTKNQLFDENEEEIIEIISFASFVPDLVSGDFSSEIRLGYKIKNNIKTPFKGGLFTGNIFEILKEMEISKETINSPGYFGPKFIKFHKAEIIGL